jgi:hypothetical protein
MDTEEARTLTKDKLNYLIYKTWKETPKDQRAVLILSAEDPEGLDTEGVYLEIVVLDDNNAVVRNRWLNYDADYVTVRTDDIYDIFRALVDQVDALEVN